MPLTCLDLRSQPHLHQPAAEILLAAFNHSAAWPTLAAAQQELHDLLDDTDNLLRGAVDESGALLGWIGAQPAYEQAWELHPLAVQPQAQGRGIGTALVRDLEQQMRNLGVGSLFLGTDDEAAQTSLADRDLYPDVLAQAASLRNIRRHPFEFYQKLGYQVVGVIPDANGPGKPDILMARRLEPASHESD